VRVLYRFIGEEGDPAAIVAEGQAEMGSAGSAVKQKRKPNSLKSDPGTGDVHAEKMRSRLKKQ